MNINVETATRDELTDELAAAGEYTEDCDTADIDDLRDRTRQVAAILVGRVREILDAKAQAGNDAYLWLHDSGDCILWPSEAESENDDGKNAIERWQLEPAEAAALIDTGEVSDIA